MLVNYHMAMSVQVGFVSVKQQKTASGRLAGPPDGHSVGPAQAIIASDRHFSGRPASAPWAHEGSCFDILSAGLLRSAGLFRPHSYASKTCEISVTMTPLGQKTLKNEVWGPTVWWPTVWGPTVSGHQNWNHQFTHSLSLDWGPSVSNHHIWNH